MIARLLLPAALLLFPASAIAQDLTDTHEQISVPGKAITAYRPIKQNAAAPTKCHPDPTKAVACEAAALRALTDKRDAEAGKTGSR